MKNMSIFEIVLIGIGLAMDAFAVAICKGLSMKKISLKKCTIIGTYFGMFQGIMPTIGFILGISFQEIITKVDHWIAFILLGVIGINMIKESFLNEDNNINDQVNLKTMLPLAIATSIDALAIGITFAFLKVNIFLATTIITITTYLISFIGVIIGNKLGNKLEKKAQIFGGTVLIVIGTKILLEHLNIL